MKAKTHAPHVSDFELGDVSHNLKVGCTFQKQKATAQTHKMLAGRAFLYHYVSSHFRQRKGHVVLCKEETHENMFSKVEKRIYDRKKKSNFIFAMKSPNSQSIFENFF